MEAGITLAVVSDIHAYGGHPDEAPSYVRAPGCSGDPFDKLKKLATEQVWQADLLLCPGDICDSADSDGLIHAWDRLHDLAGTLGSRLIATAGNHDLDSRFLKSDFDPKGTLQSLDPPFPDGTDEGRDRFWARNYTISVDGPALTVSLNSAAFHGYHNEERAAAEFNHGRVSHSTVDRLTRDLDAIDDSGIHYRFLVCHHHPHVVGPFRDAEGDSAMRDSAYLLHKLETSGHDWVIVHGHRHFPFLTYSGGSVVFSSGSFSRVVGDLYEGTVGNQFYFIRIGSPEYAESVGLDLAGTFESWNWIGGEWVRAPQLRGLPPHGGFGYHGPMNALSTQMHDFVDGAGGPVKWADLVDGVPLLRHVTPIDLVRVLERAASQWASLTPPLADLPVGWPPEQVSTR